MILDAHRGNCWIGREVEGALASESPLTAFIRSKLSDEQLTAVVARQVSCVFLVEGFNDWSWFVDVLRKRLGPDVTYTIALRPHELAQRHKIPGRVHGVIRVLEDADWVGLLRPDDEVSIGQQYDLVTWRVGDGVRTMPLDYRDDERI